MPNCVLKLRYDKHKLNNVIEQFLHARMQRFAESVGKSFDYKIARIRTRFNNRRGWLNFY